MHTHNKYVQSARKICQTYFVVCFQRACYLSINPLKEETADTEKTAYTLPDGSTMEVGVTRLIGFKQLVLQTR